MSGFTEKVLAWFDQNGRKSLPWKSTSIAPEHRPYRIWLSEVMLQQTQVTTMLPYYQRFIEQFPTLESLALGTLDEVLALWSGLGYYARGRNLHKAAVLMWQEHQAVPDNFDELLALPGIGRSTAGAIMAQAFHQPYPILDGNVKRVLARYHAVEGWYGTRAVSDQLWSLSIEHTPDKRVADYTQAIMDIGALLCTRSKPVCDNCNLSTDCRAFQTGRTSELPTPKPKKIKPVKQVHVLCFLDNNKVMLEQRPPSGIWGGLWSFPEFRSQVDLHAHLVDNLNADTTHSVAMDSFRHTFSHYHLDIHPHVIRVSDKMSTQVNDSTSRYFSLSEKLGVGIAAPVKRLLDDLSEIDF